MRTLVLPYKYTIIYWGLEIHKFHFFFLIFIVYEIFFKNTTDLKKSSHGIYSFLKLLLKTYVYFFFLKEKTYVYQLTCDSIGYEIKKKKYKILLRAKYY